MHKDFHWSDIYLHWCIHSMDMRWERKISFTPMLINSPKNGLQIGTDILDWWPTDRIAQRCDALEKHGRFGATWGTNKGTLHTVQLLYEQRSDEEVQAAILIAASMWDKLKSIPEAWHGDTFRLINGLLRLVVSDEGSPFYTLELPRWHHAMREALPVNIVTEEFAEFCKPQRYEDLVYIARLESTLGISTWTPVIVSHNETGSKETNGNET